MTIYVHNVRADGDRNFVVRFQWKNIFGWVRFVVAAKRLWTHAAVYVGPVKVYQW